MFSVKKTFKRVLSYIIALIIGVSIPLLFACLDLLELEVEFSVLNIIDMLQSQNVYVFSAIFFPVTCLVIGHLIFRIRDKNKILESDFEYLKIVLDASPEAIVFLNEEKEIVFQNNQFKLFFTDVSEIIRDSEKNNYFESEQYIQKDVTLISKLSHEHPFSMSFKLTSFNDHKNYFISFKDLKDLKDQEKIIEDQKIQMVEKNKLASLGEMAAGIAHEVNNPLTVIHSNNSIVAKLSKAGKLTPDKVSTLTEKTKTQIKRISNIITSLQNLSRGLANEESENFSINQVLEEARSLATLRDKQKKIIINLIPANFEVYANRGQIVQIVLNLLNNAIDAICHQEDPWIEMTMIEDGNYIGVFILDSGSGIDKELQKKIFIPMYSTKDVGKGTGLGLSLSKTFAEQNGGSLSYIDSFNNTCFKLKIKKKVIELKEAS